MSALTNLPSKLSRAICNYLVTEGIVPRDRAFHFRSRAPRDTSAGPIVTVDVWPGNPMPALTGNSEFTVHLAIKGSAVQHPADPNNESEAVTFDALVGAVRQATMTSGDEQTLRAFRNAVNTAAYAMPTSADPGNPAADRFAENNADMADFTLLSWYDGVYGQGKAEDCHWEIALQFRCSACETRIEGYETA